MPARGARNVVRPEQSNAPGPLPPIAYDAPIAPRAALTAAASGVADGRCRSASVFVKLVNACAGVAASRARRRVPRPGRTQRDAAWSGGAWAEPPGVVCRAAPCEQGQMDAGGGRTGLPR